MNESCRRPATERHLLDVSTLEFRSAGRTRPVARRGARPRLRRALTRRRASWEREREPQPHRLRRTGTDCGLQALQEEVDVLLRNTILCHGREWTNSSSDYGRFSQYQAVCDHIMAWAAQIRENSRQSAAMQMARACSIERSHPNATCMVDILRNMVVWTSRTPASSRTPDLPPLEPSPKAILRQAVTSTVGLNNGESLMRVRL